MAPQDERNLDALLTLALPLAQSMPPRELILAEVVVPARFVTGALYDQRDVTDAIARLNERRLELVAHGVASRAVAFASASPGLDYVRLASEEEVDLILLDGRRPLLGEGVPRGPIGNVLEKAPCDVAVLVEREGIPQIDADHPVYVPFGGAEHDWAALELAAWISSVCKAPLRLVGPAAPDGDASRSLAQVALVVQKLADIDVEPLLIDFASGGVAHATEDAGLLAVGLSARWRTEGLGLVRAAIVRKASVPILFVRRGIRPGSQPGKGCCFEGTARP